MKKEYKVSLTIFLLTVTLLISISAITIFQTQLTSAQTEDMPDILGINPSNIEKIPQTPEELKEASQQYLKKEWGQILLNNTYTGPVIRGYNKNIGPWFNPILKIVLGIDPAISWLFGLTLILWILFLTYMHRILAAFSTFSNTTSFVISLAMLVVMGSIGIIRWIAEKVISTISLLTSIWMQAIVATLIIVLAIVASTFSKQTEQIMKQWKENRKKMKIAMEIEKLKAEGKSQAQIQKIITDTFGELGEVMD